MLLSHPLTVARLPRTPCTCQTMGSTKHVQRGSMSLLALARVQRSVAMNYGAYYYKKGAVHIVCYTVFPYSSGACNPTTYTPEASKIRE